MVSPRALSAGASNFPPLPAPKLVRRPFADPPALRKLFPRRLPRLRALLPPCANVFPECACRVRPSWLAAIFPPAGAPEFLLTRGGREGFATSRCPRCTPALPLLLRNSGLRYRAKSPRCGTHPAPAATPPGRPLEFRAPLTVRTESRLNPQSLWPRSFPPAPHRSRH